MSDEVFTKLFFQAVLLTKLHDGEIADKLGVSRVTVTRWTQGKNLPCVSLREPILQALAGR